MKCLYFCVILISLVCFFLDWAWLLFFAFLFSLYRMAIVWLLAMSVDFSFRFCDLFCGWNSCLRRGLLTDWSVQIHKEQAWLNG